MNALEIERAVSALFAAKFDAARFPFAFLSAFGVKATTITKLQRGDANKSDAGGILLRRKVHLLAGPASDLRAAVQSLADSAATTKHKVPLVLATDGAWVEARNLAAGKALSCAFADVPDNFGFFGDLAGLSFPPEIRENPFDIRATSSLDKLYTELLKDNPDWGSGAARHHMNLFITRIIFCFFAEDTDIFGRNSNFTATVTQMAARDGSDMGQVIGAIFRAMAIPPAQRDDAGLPVFASHFPYVNGGLFRDEIPVPRFTRATRSYLLEIGNLDWTKINPDIFGSMVQAIASEDDRGDVGMHYTSVPNILKVLNPLFLDDLRAQLADAGDNGRKLLNLRKRIAHIRVFDPACGSGNFLVIAYKKLREIEAEINHRRGEQDQKSAIPLTNFRGIEIGDFSTEIARLALVIAEYQCDVLYRGQREALAAFLPLSTDNWITHDNALRVDWLALCPPAGTGTRTRGDDLFHTPLQQTAIDFENMGGEVYICGNPPYKGSQTQAKAQKDDLAHVFDRYGISSKQIDYVGGWFMKAAEYMAATDTQVAAAFVATNSICQGRIVPILWPVLFQQGAEIAFAYQSFKWGNLAKNNAGVTVVIVALAKEPPASRRLYTTDADEQVTAQDVPFINAYLAPGANVVAKSRSTPLSGQAEMSFGNMPIDGGQLLLTRSEMEALRLTPEQQARFIRRIYGSKEFIRGEVRYCLWIGDEDLPEALAIPAITERVEGVRKMRLGSPRTETVNLASIPHRFGWAPQVGGERVTIIPSVSSEARSYLPVGYEPSGTIVSNLAFALYDAPLWNMALIASRLHLVWIGAVCGKLKTDFRYSNTLGWNTFPIPPLSPQMQADLTRTAENILLAREAHFPATIAALYEPGAMPENLRAAHAANDEIVERIYIGRRFKNDSERLEKLFALYQQAVAGAGLTQ